MANQSDFRDFAESGVIGLHWVGPDGAVLWVNQAELDMLGYTRDEYIGHNIAEFHADAPVIEDMLARLLKGEVLRDYQARLRCKNGRFRNVQFSPRGMFEDGRFIHSRFFTVDVTKKKLLETAPRKSELRPGKTIDVLPAAIYT